LVGILGNRNVGATAYDNVFRMMHRFEDKWFCETSDECTPEPYASVMSASPWFTGLAKTDLPHLIGDGSVSYVANEEDFFDQSEVFQPDTAAKDAARFRVADRALSDPYRRYHVVLLHFTDMDSQASSHGASDAYNQANMNASDGTPQDASWVEYIPIDAVGFSWRANSYKRAIARSGDMVNALIDAHGDELTTFLIMGDHGHVAPGGMGGASDDVRHVPFFGYRRGSGLGWHSREARRVAGNQERDAVRFVAQARTLDEVGSLFDLC
jgi:hypothetical protein